MSGYSSSTNAWYAVGVGAAFIWATGITINGDNSFCTTSNPYTISNLPVSASVVWSASPLGIAQINTPNAVQTTLTKTGNGQITLSAVATLGCGINQNFTATKSASVGTPPAPGITITGIEPLNFGTQMDVQVSTTAAAPYLWYVNGSLVFTAYTLNVTINGGNNCNVTNTLSVKVSNSCGPTTASTTYVRPCGNGHFAVSPNPATGMINVSVESSQEQGNAASNSVSLTKIYQIKVLGQTGNVLKQFNYSSGVTTTNIDLSTLNNGTYTLQIYDNVSWISQQVVILK